MENSLVELHNHLKSISLIFRKYFIQLQTHGYAGFYPLVVMEISHRMSAIEELKFEYPRTLKQYIELIKYVHKLYMYSSDLIAIYTSINLDKDISSSAADKEVIEADLLVCKRIYKKFKIFYDQYVFLSYVDKYIEGELDEPTILSILDEGDIYDVLPFIKYILKHSKITPAVHIKMESLKNKLLNVQDEKIEAPTVVQSLITYQNLAPATPIMPLEQLAAEYLQLQIRTIKDLNTAKTQYGFIIICKILPVSIHYNVWQLFNAAKDGLQVPLTAGVNTRLLERYNTVQIGPAKNINDQILVINRKDLNYVLQTTDGIHFMLMKEVGASTLLCTNSSFRPSMRVNTYNSIINAEIAKQLAPPYIDTQQLFTAENIEGVKTNMLVHIMQDLRESGMQYNKFFDKYDYENLILLTIESVLQSVPSEHILPYINYEFKCMYYYDLHQFRTNMRSNILDGLSSLLNLNDSAVRGVVDKVLHKLILRDRRNIFNNLNKKLILLLELFR